MLVNFQALVPLFAADFVFVMYTCFGSNEFETPISKILLNFWTFFVTLRVLHRDLHFERYPWLPYFVKIFNANRNDASDATK